MDWFWVFKDLIVLQVSVEDTKWYQEDQDCFRLDREEDGEEGYRRSSLEITLYYHNERKSKTMCTYASFSLSEKVPGFFIVHVQAAVPLSEPLTWAYLIYILSSYIFSFYTFFLLTIILF